MIQDSGVAQLESLGLFDGIDLIIQGFIGFLIFLRIVSIVRVSKDIHARTSSIALQMACILLVTILTPLLGLPLYFVIRPIYYRK